MMKPSVRAEADLGPRYFCAAGRSCRPAVFAVLAALVASPGCSSDPGAELPLQPCGVEGKYYEDEVVLAYSHRGYDERGNHVLTERDFDIDGVIDSRFIWQYAPGGELIRASRDFGDGVMEEVVVEYGDDDRLESVTWRNVSEQTGRADYEHDGEQRIIEHWDRNDDGAVEESVTYTYDADGKPAGSSSRCAGAVEPRSISTMRWGQDGRIERIENEAEGEPSAVTEFTYDQDGLLERWERSYDGEVSIRETFERDSAGNVKGSSFASGLAPGQDPRDLQAVDTVYDADGRIRSQELAIGGQLAAEFTFLYECPGHEDSPGRHLGAPESPLPPPPMGPRGGVGSDTIDDYALTFIGACL
jgi:hypothetical protein